MLLNSDNTKRIGKYYRTSVSDNVFYSKLIEQLKERKYWFRIKKVRSHVTSILWKAV